MSTFKLLAIGDVVGPEAVKYISEKLWVFRNANKINMVVCNSENACNGNGIDPQSSEELLSGGCDVLTGGNHTFRKKEIRRYLDDSSYAIRPANLPAGTPGNGYTTVNIDGIRVLVINVLGTIYLESLACPFATIDRILERETGSYDIAVLDIHAEATSEKIALGRYFDGRIAAIFGTHTHVATADMQILPKGSGYVTDLGMSGPPDGVLGIRADIIIEKLRTKLPVKFEFAEGATEVNGVIFTLDTDKNRCVSVERVKF
ncbi:MAG: TIGR00282 family metallophosphoesterase [Clostridiales bacterium]|nr:TIGR00282 family metallophosphoesterase [Clostridiales bacterium]